jgi:hypothetical protein
MHREAKFEELTEHPKLYNYIDGIPGEGFIRPDKLPNINVIVPLNPQQAENLPHQLLDPFPVFRAKHDGSGFTKPNQSML